MHDEGSLDMGIIIHYEHKCNIHCSKYILNSKDNSHKVKYFSKQYTHLIKFLKDRRKPNYLIILN